jgi:ubiquinone/menaquinone biosynthesis C-methylase UbiE
MRNITEANKVAYDKKAKKYDNTLDGRFTEKFKKLLLENMAIQDRASVLDVGCGNGSLLSRITKNIQGFGIDVSTEMVSHAQATCPNYVFVASDSENIPFGENSMDVIIACAAYHHFPRVDLFSHEAKRVLKPGGIIYIAEIYLPGILRQIANIFLPLSKDGDVKFYSPREIMNTFENAGFTVSGIVKKGHIQIINLRSE